MGVPPAIAVGTQANQLVASSLSGALGHWTRGNVDVKLGNVLGIGGFLGSVIGILIFKLLQVFGHVDAVISILYVLVLGSVGLLMLRESLVSLVNKTTLTHKIHSPLWDRLIKNLPLQMYFPRSKLYISALVPIGIGVVGGLLVSLMGIGGGFLLVPAMIYLLGLPGLLVVGTSLYNIIFTAAFATLLHAMANHTVDLVLAILLIIGGVIGAQLGLKALPYLKGTWARLALAVLLLAVSAKLGMDLFVPPLDVFNFQVK
jgi:hypothetical protein